MTRPPTHPVGLKVEATMSSSAEISAKSVCLLRTHSILAGMLHNDPKRHNLLEGVSKCMMARQEARFNEYCEMTT